MADVTAAGTGATGLGAPAARWALGFSWLLSIVWGGVEGSLVAPGAFDLLPYLTLFVGGVLLTTPGDQPLGVPRALGVAACSLATVGFVLATLETAADTWLGNLGFYLVALQIARGNIVIGGVGAVLGLSGGLVWGFSRGAPAEAIADLLAVPVIAVIAGLTWRPVLRRAVSLERSHRSEAARAARETAAAIEAAEANRAELAEIRQHVEPLLRRIADGEPLDSLRRDLEVTEGGIRDRIRTPGLQHPALTAAIADRRHHGIQVVLLGDGETELQPGLLQTLTELVQAATEGRVTVRVMPPDRGAAASVVHEQAGRLERTVLGPDGSVLARH